MGTLGGGNHFLEAQYDQFNNVWFMVHSGSRNIGKKICDHFNDIALNLNKKWHSNCNIPFLPVDTLEGQLYLQWMNIALRFALLNRRVMLESIKNYLPSLFPNVKFLETNNIDPTNPNFFQANQENNKDNNYILNIHHNYASLEHHYNQNLWIHRKGATLASNNIGIIPGSMGSNSYITKGLNNKESLYSSSHGAGRLMGRMDFNRLSNNPAKLEEIENSLKNITHTPFGPVNNRKKNAPPLLDVSEAPNAYKNIDQVMQNQSDLVSTLFKLQPIINWKDSNSPKDD